WSSNKIQPLAKKLIYEKIWPESGIISLDKGQDSLKLILDVGGADKLLRHPDGTISFLAQRFRRWESWHPRNYDDFTIRATRPTGRLTEVDKILKGIKSGTLIAAYYAYGHVNEAENGFSRFRIIDLPKFTLAFYNQEIIPGKMIMNPDNSSGFLAWQFKDLPSKIMFFDLNRREENKQLGFNF
ncbi:unnamed protein product, partial [marine sediment metagenome]